MNLMKIQGFGFYIVVVFLNAFTDLGHKIMIQNTVFKVYDGTEQVVLTAIVNALILLPFIFLFSPSGFIGDRYQKSHIMRIAAVAAVIITLLITLGYYMGWFWFAFCMTFVLAVQSAIYSPAKYGYIKEVAGEKNIAPANAMVQSVTIVAILGGIFFYSIGFETLLSTNSNHTTEQILKDIAPMGWFLVVGSIVEMILAYRLSDLSKPKENIEFSFDSYYKGRYLKKNLKILKTNEIILLSIVGLSVFWGLSQAVLASFPAFAKSYLGVTNAIVVQGLMAVSGIGIIFGSILASRLSKEKIEIGLVTIATIGITISIFNIVMIESLILQGVNFLLFGMFGGLLIVPLNSLIQLTSGDKRLGVVLAGNNFIQNIVMFIFLVMTIFVALFNIDVVNIFMILTIISIVGVFYTMRKTMANFLEFLITSIIKIVYRFKVIGSLNIPKTGGVLLLGNHISWLDWAFVAIASPRKVRFVMERSIYQNKKFRWFLDLFDVIPISTKGGKESLKKVASLIENGDVVCIFAEGSITRTGTLGEFKKGFEIACKDIKSGVIVPFYINGMFGKFLSRARVNFKTTSDVIVSFGEQIPISSNRATLKQKVFELSVESWDRYISDMEPLDVEFLHTAKKMRFKTAIIDNQAGKFNYYKTLVMAIMFSKEIAKRSEQNIGLLLPTVSVGAIFNISSLIAGKTSVNLNYTASIDAIKSAISQADIKVIYTSKKFESKLKSKGVDIEQIYDKVDVIYLEYYKDTMKKSDALSLIAQVILLPSFILRKLHFSNNNTINSTATILFSSGSEGSPKGVVLSHKNILANLKQAIELINPSEDEMFLSSLPIFHAFGLTVTTFLPVIEGIPTVMQPDPTDAFSVGKAVAKYNVTFMCATSTFLRLYTKNRKLKPEMFESLRLVIAGAEKLNPNIAKEFKNKFNKDIFEGYGATEATPVISCNVPNIVDTNFWAIQLGAKSGSVGMALPGIATRIVDPNTLERLPDGEAGLLIVSGANIMSGYLNNPDKNKDSLVDIDGMRWYKTGDKCSIDDDGFITIVDRYSRFAKLAGEMISLSAVEGKIESIVSDDEVRLVCVNIPDEKKGEKIILILDTDIEDIKDKIDSSDINPLWIPSEIKVVDELPVLGSGKIDFKSAKKLVV